MFSLQKFLGKEATFFSLFERAINEAEECAASAERLLHDPKSPELLAAVTTHRLNNKHTCEEISELLLKSFVTALEREDIEALSNILYRLPKPVEKFAQRFAMAHEFVPEVDFHPQVELITRAVRIVHEMVKELRELGGRADVRSLNTQLQQVEAEGDDLEIRLLKGLYESRTNAIRIMIVKDLYGLLEKSLDRCRDAGSLVTHIVLKNA